MKFTIGSFLLFLISFSLYASESDCEDIFLWQIGADYTSVHISTAPVPSFCGHLGGIQAGVEYFGMDRGIYAALKGTWKGGQTTNDSARRSLTYVDVQERMGITVCIAEPQLSLTLFTGLGYRHLGHHWRESGVAAVKFNYDDFYVPIGVLTEYALCFCQPLETTMGLNFIWMPDIYPTVGIVPLKGARWTLRNRFDHFLVEMPFTFSIEEFGCYALIFKPFYEHWSDGRSTARTASGQALNLPANHYNFVGIELNITAQF